MEIHTQTLVQPLTRRNRIECKPELVIAKLQKFYQNTPDIDNLMPYLTGTAPISLRIIDWFVTKESRKNFTQFTLNSQKFVVFLSYKGQLRAYSKKYFDPNCRRERIMFEIPGKEPFLTTIGKLNFFRWAYECRVIEYIENNIDTLRENYNKFLRDNMASLKRNQESGSVSSTASSTQINCANSTTTNMKSGTSSASSTLSAQSALTNSTVLTQNSVSGLSISLTSVALSNPNRNTRRRRSKQIPSSLHQLQIQNENKPIILNFS